MKFLAWMAQEKWPNFWYDLDVMFRMIRGENELFDPQLINFKNRYSHYLLDVQERMGW